MNKPDSLPLTKRRLDFLLTAGTAINLTGYVLFGEILVTTWTSAKSWYVVFGVFVLALIAFSLVKKRHSTT